MKYFYILAAAFYTHLAFSQDARLFDNPWYLQNIVIDGVDNLPPTGVGFIMFMPDTPELAGGGLCNNFFANYSFSASNPNEFSLTNANSTLMGCPEVFDYDHLYYMFYLQNTNFTYDITDTDGSKNLTIYAGNTHHVFNDVVLSTEVPHRPSLEIFPNPASDCLTLTIDNPTGKGAHIEIYNNCGQLCMTQEMATTSKSIDVRTFSKGIYNLRIKTDTAIINKKWIKL